MSNPEQLAMIRHSVKEWNEWRENSDKEIDLRGAYLSGTDLSGTDLSGTDLRGADLIRADLRGADLRGADLSGADLRGADLSGAYLREADLSGAYLSGADLRGAYLRGAIGLSKLPSCDPRGYEAYVQSSDPVRRIQAGCRYLTLSEGRDHWGQRYKGDRKIGDHYLWLIDLAEAAPEQDGVIDVIGALRCLQQSTT